MRNPNCRCSAEGRTRPNFLITSIPWCTCGFREGKTRETSTEETSETVKTKDTNIDTFEDDNVGGSDIPDPL